MQTPRLTLIVLLPLLSFLALVAAEPRYSALWGERGEKWTVATSRLPDVSRAGYHSGDDPLPQVPFVSDVQPDFGAKGNGVTDDSEAFLAVVTKSPVGAIRMPAGRYVITRVIQISRSGIVLRGDGPDRSVLYFPEPLLTAAPRQRPDGDWNFNRALSQPQTS